MGSNDLAKSTARQTPDLECKQQACCSSPSAMCYWCSVSLAAWGLLSILGAYWYPRHPTSAATILFAAAIGCFANRFKNRTFHCGITAWLFLVGAVVFLLTDVGVIQIEPRFVWPFVGVGTLLAFILEWRYAHRAANHHL
ncbi:MAG TPA: hypothetical protein VJ731_02345 [Terriglobales bacterium]|nr:hypothetical protein [Terriglobales bacterium]